MYRRSFEQAAQDYLRDDDYTFTDDNDALVHELCQHSAIASKENYCATGEVRAYGYSEPLSQNFGGEGDGSRESTVPIVNGMVARCSETFCQNFNFLLCRKFFSPEKTFETREMP